MKETRRVLTSIPEDRRAAKVGRTKTGSVIVLLGVSLVVAGICLALSVVEAAAASGTEMSLFGLLLGLLPMGVGVLMCLLGATVWSGEIVTAAFKDVLGAVSSIVRVFRKGGA